MKKLLFLLLLIPNLVMGDEKYFKSSEIKEPSLPSLVEREDKNLSISQIKEQLPLFNIKDFYSKDIKEECMFSNERFTENINTNKKIKFVTKKVIGETNKINYSINNEQLFIQINNYKSFEIHTGEVAFVIYKYKSRTTVPIIDLTILESDCNTFGYYYVDQNNSYKTANTQYINIPPPFRNINKITISLDKYKESFNIDSNGYLINGNGDPSLSGVNLDKILQYVQKNKNTQLKVVCESCVDKKTEVFSIDLKQALSIYEQKGENRKRKLEAKLRIDSLINKINNTLKQEHYGSYSPAENAIKSFCNKKWAQEASYGSKVRDKGYESFIYDCKEYHPFLERFLNDFLRESNLKNKREKEAKAQKIKREKEAKAQKIKREKDAKAQKIKKEKDAKALEKKKKISTINKLKDECESIGFKKGTTKFKNCVLELM